MDLRRELELPTARWSRFEPEADWLSAGSDSRCSTLSGGAWGGDLGGREGDGGGSVRDEGGRGVAICREEDRVGMIVSLDQR